MKSIALLLIAVVTPVCVVAAQAPTSEPADEAAAAISGGKLPAGYRDWRLISVAREEGSLDDTRAVLGNDAAIRVPGRDASVPRRHHHSPACLGSPPVEGEQQSLWQSQSFVAGPPKNVVQFMA
jgi:hypothetical protein